MVKPAAVIAVVAAACVSPTIFGPVAPVETTRLTADPLVAEVPPVGLWLMTLPEGTVGLDWVVTVPTVSPAAVMAVVAAAWVSPTTLGTSAPAETTRLTADRGGAEVPLVGLWLMTLPEG